MDNETINAQRNVKEWKLDREWYKPRSGDVLNADNAVTESPEPAPFVDPRLVAPSFARDEAPLLNPVPVTAAPEPLIGALSDRDFLGQFMDRPEQRALIPHRERQDAEIFGYFSALDIAAGIAAAVIMIGPLAAAAIGALTRG